MSSPLDRLADLKAEPPDAAEVAGLKSAADQYLADAKNSQLSAASRFTLAYDAAYAYSLAGLRHRGYRAKNRYIVFQVLPHTLGVGPEVWRVAAKAHELRNVAQYHGDFSADSRIVEDLLSTCEILRDAVEALPPMPGASGP